LAAEEEQEVKQSFNLLVGYSEHVKVAGSASTPMVDQA